MKKFIYTVCFLLLSVSRLQATGTPQPSPFTEIPSPAPELFNEAMPTTPSYEYAFLKMIVSLLILLVLIFLTVWALKRLSTGRLKIMNQTLSIKLLEKRAISPKSVLYLIEVEGKRILIAESQLEVRLLTPIDKAKDE